MKKKLILFMKEARQRPEKVWQYCMLLVLFGLAFFLPIYGVRQQTKESAGRNVKIKEEDTDARGKESKGTIVLDAGHGGFDNGVVSRNGITEKELNLIYAKKLEDLLTKEGYRIVQTRSTEAGLYKEEDENKKAQDMKQRCQIIKQESPLLTISIHQNSYPQDTAVCGPQVFYYEKSKEGKKLAETLQKNLNDMQNVLRKREAKGNSTYYILKHSPGVTVIVECGFLTNPEEEEMLQEETYQDQVVYAMLHGILKYLSK